ncbi:MAG TPA: cation diffusion facilitator family transporter, partial [Casimicrobium huifangae]|nr:cation diffusion facilitator family transporter [Casimicrobium huifangae]
MHGHHSHHASDDAGHPRHAHPHHDGDAHGATTSSHPQKEAHGHGHGHTHGHGGHAHAHGPINYDRIFAIGVALNVSYALIEAVAGFWLHSLALVADAGHNLSDVLGLLLAWAAVWLSRRKPSARHSYGLGRTSILAALANAVLLFVALGAIVWEAIGRLNEPQVVATGPVIVIALIGI